MPRSTDDESKEDYISRFMASPEAREDYPDEKQRAAVAYSMWEHRNEVENSKSYPKLFKCRHIEAGLVHYNEYGTVLVKKEVLDKMSGSFVGKPVVNEAHRNVRPENFLKEADGVVTRHWFNESDGWYYAEFLVWDDATMRNCQSHAYSVSCAYNVSQVKKTGGEYHNIPYEQEVMDGEYTHLAVVANPRYEGARIILNSKGGREMKLKFWEKKKEEVQNASEMDLDKAIVEIDGAEIPMKELIDMHVAHNAAPTKVSPETMIEIDGKKVSVKELTDLYNAKKAKKVKNFGSEDRESKALKKEEEEEDERKEIEDTKNNKEHEDGKHDDKEADNCSMCNDSKDERKNKNEDHFESIRATANRRGDPQVPQLVTLSDQVAEGKKRYGTIVS